MGREIRMVPPNWEHPKIPCRHTPKCKGWQCYQPMYDRTFDEAMAEWLEEFEKWKLAGHDEAIAKHGESEYPKKEPYRSFCKWHMAPPDPDYYHPDFGDTATWYQVYQTVSEGSPVTPPFATQDELIHYLATYGDFWDQNRGDGPWSVESAYRFVKGEGWLPSMIVKSTAEGVVIQTPRDM